MVAGAGLEPATFGLWAQRAANCSTPLYILVAGVEGLEPPAFGFGDRCATNYAIPLYFRFRFLELRHRMIFSSLCLVPRKGFEPSTHGLKGRCATSCATGAYWMVGQVGVEPTVYLTLRIYSPLHSPLCTLTHIAFIY